MLRRDFGSLRHVVPLRRLTLSSVITGFTYYKGPCIEPLDRSQRLTAILGFRSVAIESSFDPDQIPSLSYIFGLSNRNF